MIDPVPDQMPRISDHGVIGDLRTAGLVAGDGALDWLCVPRFDSPSVFGRILDAAGGAWELGAAGEESATTRQFYLPDTNVLVTRFSAEHGVVEVQDLMPVLAPHDPDHRQRLVRRVLGIRGELSIETRIAPRFDYGRAQHTTERTDDGVRFTADTLTLQVTTSLPLEIQDGAATGATRLGAGDELTFVLDVLSGDETRPDHDVRTLLEETVAFWRAWIGRSTYTGRWRDLVNRSALTLKLLTHEPSGAIIAAVTTSLPEEIGGSRNWDYRHVWIRDAAFTLYALLRLGFLDEANAFMDWLLRRLDDEDGEGDGPLRSMYDIDGDSTGGEFTLDHWSGYRDSAPVRVRNDAADQLQLDVYGELIDSIYLFDKYGGGISWDSWQALTDVVDWLLDNWHREDAGIWETRGGRRAHTFSRMMSWVAVERMMRMARRRGRPGDMERWRRTRDAIAEAVIAESWDDERGAFTRAAGSDVLDASLLLMPSVKFLPPSDPRFAGTLQAIEATLVTDALVFRYDTSRAGDGLDGGEGTFSMCSFWYVEALTRVGRLDDARLALEKMFTYANPLGLYAEEISVAGDQLGNFPQAFTHLSLISAAINLDAALG